MSVLMGRMSWRGTETHDEEGRNAMREQGVHEGHEEGWLLWGSLVYGACMECQAPAFEKRALPNSLMGSTCWPKLATIMDKRGAIKWP